ncbi:MAG: 16S rRNA (cytidine(1402)-2'-O)-methyltransferase [Planctomycetota bacterium]|nr:16S rRNA (cytidine(1402)-2'-O)-methyltransferase [Planctomycetota bacterium]MDI6787271.1 16S rRNA (cytidine(1402)-2'-O)-methyltransferase [Planctomycetota bacterium]
MSKGILYIVATPIGNLDDITLRAIKLLKEVDLIACEDTRIALRLLNHNQIEKPLISYFEHNKERRSSYLIDKLLTGIKIALISNAGTPLISDPGYELVKLCIQNEIPVISIPGASAITSALAISGLSSDRFIFEGFLPRKPAKRRRRLQILSTDERTIIIYESPHRIHKTLLELKNILGNRQMVMAREMTKLYEETKRGTIEEILNYISGKKVKGEITLVIAGSNKT